MEDNLNGPLSPECAPVLGSHDMWADLQAGLHGIARVMDCDGNFVCSVPVSIDARSLSALLAHGEVMHSKGVSVGREVMRREIRSILGLSEHAAQPPQAA